jgi:hypothetical protein
MWILKGVSLGTAFFISAILGLLAYIYVSGRVEMYLLARGHFHLFPQSGSSNDLLAVFALAIALGLWIMRPRRARTA